MKIPKNINWGSAPIAAGGCHFSSGDQGRASNTLCSEAELSGLAITGCESTNTSCNSLDLGKVCQDLGCEPMVANSLPVNAPKDAHNQAITLIKTVYDFLPEHYHQQIEFSFQIPDSQAEKING